MSYAEVAVDIRTTPGKTFSYSIPPQLTVRVGHAVQVPFGSRHLPGFVFEITETPSYPETKNISRVIDTIPWLSKTQVALARWISATYFASLYSAAALMIPPGFRQRVAAVYGAVSDPPETSLRSLDERQGAVLRFIREHGQVAETLIERHFGKRPAGVILGQLARKRLAVKTWEWVKPRVSVKLVAHAKLAIEPPVALQEAGRLAGSRAAKQGAVLQALAEADGNGIPVAALDDKLGTVRTALATLAKRGLVTVSRERTERDPLAGRAYPITRPERLTPYQEKAWREISSALEAPSLTPSVFLLHGVTGSGKTELYLLALEKVVAQGRRGIALVPEISLTAQTIERFSGRFPGRVAVLHSRLSPGEHFDQWWRIREGAFDVVIGSRGAVFAPQPDLGLIVLDEEHEWTYKQQDPEPRYHARDVAIKLAELTGATVILGSATPQHESYYRAQSGAFRLLTLPDRVVPDRPARKRRSPALAQVQLVDMREEIKLRNMSVFSRALHDGITTVLKRKEQAILFLNRRGAATFVQCRDCGYVARCKRCDSTLTYHAEDPQLRCHQCNAHVPPPMHCPQCWGPHIRYMGLGTERLEYEVSKAFPNAMTLRWDRDVARDAASHEAILQQFLRHDADILIGTQMIAKGLHLPEVTLVGVVNADIGLHAPDFRAAERVFQVLCQVAGRSGRGDMPGRVIIQTYSPQHYAIVAATLQDYHAFYEQEKSRRMEAGLPPFSRLLRLLYLHTNQAAARREAERLYRLLKERLDAWAFPGARLIGPVPAPIDRIRGRYRWHIIILAPDPLVLLKEIVLPEGWAVDVDPVQLL